MQIPPHLFQGFLERPDGLGKLRQQWFEGVRDPIVQLGRDRLGYGVSPQCTTAGQERNFNQWPEIKTVEPTARAFANGQRHRIPYAYYWNARRLVAAVEEYIRFYGRVPYYDRLGKAQKFLEGKKSLTRKELYQVALLCAGTFGDMTDEAYGFIAWNNLPLAKTGTDVTGQKFPVPEGRSTLFEGVERFPWETPSFDWPFPHPRHRVEAGVLTLMEMGFMGAAPAVVPMTPKDIPYDNIRGDAVGFYLHDVLHEMASLISGNHFPLSLWSTVYAESQGLHALERERLLIGVGRLPVGLQSVIQHYVLSRYWQMGSMTTSAEERQRIERGLNLSFWLWHEYNFELGGRTRFWEGAVDASDEDRLRLLTEGYLKAALGSFAEKFYKGYIGLQTLKFQVGLIETEAELALAVARASPLFVSRGDLRFAREFRTELLSVETGEEQGIYVVDVKYQLRHGPDWRQEDTVKVPLVRFDETRLFSNFRGFVDPRGEFSDFEVLGRLLQNAEDFKIDVMSHVPAAFRERA